MIPEKPFPNDVRIIWIVILKKNWLMKHIWERQVQMKPPSSLSIALVGQVLAWKQCLTDRTPSLFIIIFTSVCISYFQWPLVNLGLVSKLYTIPSTINTWLIWHMKWGLECIRRINHGLFSLFFKVFWSKMHSNLTWKIVTSA